jgi:hypothetical protein
MGGKSVKTKAFKLKFMRNTFYLNFVVVESVGERERMKWKINILFTFDFDTTS